MTRHAAAGLGFGPMMRMPSNIRSDRTVALQTHLVGIVREFQRGRVVSGPRRMRIVARRAGRAPLSKTLRPRKRLDDEGGRAVAAITIEGRAGEVGWKVCRVGPVELRRAFGV